jgi:hypothetical protein
MAAMERSAIPFVEQCTHPDGRLIWRSTWTSMDGTDNAYESFLSFPLFYLLGAGDEILTLARRAWEGITQQFTDYGTVERGFVKAFDWFHHSESYTYLYYLALADPEEADNRARALDFAAMYTGNDPLAHNWDAERKMLRSPLNGSGGPRTVTTQVDWEYHRPILSNYLAPYEDIPGVESTDPFVKVDWTDDGMLEKILDLINARMVRGDVPLNLSATSLVTHAYLYTGEEKYKQWVLDYLQAWIDRRDRNNGIVPDNVGPSGEIGELMGGKWWGGYYGWRWPHGARNIIEPALVAGACATLMTGDTSWLDLARSQLDLLWSLRREEDGALEVPARHGEQGWFDYRVPEPAPYIHLWYMSQSEEDLARLDEVFPAREGFDQLRPNWHAFKAGVCPPTAWLAFIEGRHPGYPEQMVEETTTGIHQSLDRLEADDSDREKRECYHFQNLNPVVPEGMVQMAMGTPAALYNGGLLHAAVRYFDPAQKQAGLPDHVAALVEKVEADQVNLVLVNTDPVQERIVGIQAGSFGEHEFTQVRVEGREGDEGRQAVQVDGPYVQVLLGPASQARLSLGVKRFANRPSYAFPDWD